MSPTPGGFGADMAPCVHHNHCRSKCDLLWEQHATVSVCCSLSISVFMGDLQFEMGLTVTRSGPTTLWSILDRVSLSKNLND